MSYVLDDVTYDEAGTPIDAFGNDTGGAHRNRDGSYPGSTAAPSSAPTPSAPAPYDPYAGWTVDTFVGAIFRAYPTIANWNSIRSGDSGGVFASDPLLQAFGRLVGPLSNWNAYSPLAQADPGLLPTPPAETPPVDTTPLPTVHTGPSTPRTGGSPDSTPPPVQAPPPGGVVIDHPGPPPGTVIDLHPGPYTPTYPAPPVIYVPPPDATTPPTTAPALLRIVFHVINAATGAPVFNAICRLIPSPTEYYQTQTDASGDGVVYPPAGAYGVQVNAVGAQTFIGSTTITGPATLNVSLHPLTVGTPVGGGVPGGGPVPGGIPPVIVTGPGTGAKIDPFPTTVTTTKVSVPTPPPPPGAPIVTVDGVSHISGEWLKEEFIPPIGPPWISAAIIAFTFLSSLFGSGASDDHAGQQIHDLEAQVIQLAAAILNVEGNAAAVDGVSTGLLGKILGGLGAAINAIAGLVGDISGKLAKFFGPLLKFINDVKDIVKRIYTTWLKPIIAVIDVVRGFLKVLELFHVQWAQVADDALGRLEAKLTKPILLALATLNEISNVVNRIVTLDGLLQRVTLLRSTWAHAGALLAQSWHVMTKTINPVNTAILHGMTYPRADPQTYAAALTDYYEGNGGQLAGYVDEALVPAWRQAAGLDAFTPEV